MQSYSYRPTTVRLTLTDPRLNNPFRKFAPSSRLTFDLLIVALGEVEHGPGGTLWGLTEPVAARVLADADEDAAVAVGKVGQRLAGLLLGSSSLVLPRTGTDGVPDERPTRVFALPEVQRQVLVGHWAQ